MVVEKVDAMVEKVSLEVVEVLVAYHLVFREDTMEVEKLVKAKKAMEVKEQANKATEVREQKVTVEEFVA